ncbi:MAG: metallophosphoesterase family protein [candidate division Zixibacteria bacterium]|nr:metallophosphoesterase family protein [candidate division Zixibacteria bacterium]
MALIGLLSDVHANLEALKAVFSDMEKQKIDVSHFLGDAVGYGCDPNACVGLIDKNCDIKIIGNHDFGALGIESAESFNELARTSLEWTTSEITKRSLATLAEFKLEAKIDNIHLVHASPKNPESWEYILGVEQAKEQFEGGGSWVTFLGHTHIPAFFSVDKSGTVSQKTLMEAELDEDKRYIINVGSVGQPRDRDPRCCYLTFDTESRYLRFHRIDYDISAAQRRMEALGFPKMLSERLALGR